MFSKSLGRAARSQLTLQGCCSQAARSTQGTTAAAKTTPTSRRYSSSKAPCPPGDGRGSSEPAAESSASSASTTRTPTEEPKRSSGRATRRKGRDASELAVKARDEQFAALPSVPPLNLPVPDWNLSRFFAQDRPLSITHPIPPPSTTSAFNALFTPKSIKQKSEDVIYTLSSAVSGLEHNGHGQSGEEKDLRWELVQAQAQGGSFDGQSVEQLTKRFRPFNVPPVPVPFDEVEVAGGQGKRAAGQRAKEMREGAEGKAMRRKTYKTTLTISEATSADGQPTYTFSASPMVEHEGGVARQRSGIRVVSPGMARRLSPSTLTVLPVRPKAVPVTASGITVTKHNAAAAAEASVVKEKKMARGVRVELTDAEKRVQKKKILAASVQKAKMELISVKRRRQLKMKKHKYKKLMKRTRNLRRREGRN